MTVVVPADATATSRAQAPGHVVPRTSALTDPARLGECTPRHVAATALEPQTRVKYHGKMRTATYGLLWLIFGINAAAFLLPIGVGLLLGADADRGALGENAALGLRVLRSIFALGVVVAATDIFRVGRRHAPSDRLLLAVALAVIAVECVRVATYALDVDLAVTRVIDVALLPDLLLLLVFRHSWLRTGERELRLGTTAAGTAVAIGVLDRAAGSVISDFGSLAIAATEGLLIIGAIACWALMLSWARRLPSQ